MSSLCCLYPYVCVSVYASQLLKTETVEPEEAVIKITYKHMSYVAP
jgi:hypothetical protein